VFVIEIVLLAAFALNQADSTEAFVACVRTSIDSSGRTSKSRVIVSSGSTKHDRGVLEFLKALDFSRVPMGVELGQTGHILVRASAGGTYTIDVTERRLLETCPGEVEER
jgi:hypothetical protein